MKSEYLLKAAVAAFLFTAGCSPAATEREYHFHLQDQIGRQWQNEHISFRFEPETDAFHPHSVRLHAPEGFLPVQVVNMEYGPDQDTIISADLHFLLPELEPLQRRDFVVRYGNLPAATQLPAAQLQISDNANSVTVSTGIFEAELLIGGQIWDAAIASADVPGPLAAMQLADGRSCGAGGLYGDTDLTAWSGECTARGPVFAEFTYHYKYSNGVELKLIARIFAGDSAILWDMHTTGGDLPKDGVRFILNNDLPALTFVCRAEFYSKRDSLLGREVKPGDLLSLPLQDYPRDWSINQLRASQAQLGLITRLTPWNDWWDDSTQTAIVLKIDTPHDQEYKESSVAALSIMSRKAGDWMQPAPPGTSVSHGAVYPRMMPLLKSEEGDVYLEANLTEGSRSWIINFYTPTREKEAEYIDDKTLLVEATKTEVGRELKRLNEWVLYWPEDKGTHPRVYVSQHDLDTFWQEYEPETGELEALLQATSSPPGRVHWRVDSMAMRAWLLTGSKDVAEQAHLQDRLRYSLGLLGNYDRMRNASRIAVMYDLLIDSDLIAPDERPLLQAQLAYLGYFLASPENWSMERGYASGNLNMSVAHVLNLAILAATIPDHPMAGEWSAGALAMMEQWLDQNVGPAGEFLGPGESQANYAPVSAAKLITYGIAAMRAGFHNFADDPRMRALVLCLAQQMTPPDVRFPAAAGLPIAGTPASGRGPKGQRHGLAGMMARATADRDPEFSAVMQWSWNRTGNSTAYLRDRLGGLESVYLNTELPATVPDWHMHIFPRLGAIMRHGIGTDKEWYINFLLESSALTAFDSESGGFPGIWAHGVPISVRFGGKGYGEREELLISRVLPAREVGTDEYRRPRFRGISGARQMIATSELPRQQYVAAEIPMQSRRSSSAHYELMKLPAWPAVESDEAELPVHWLRQIVFVRDADPGGSSYIVLRDTVSGAQPTTWQFWTLSEKIGTAAEVRNRESFLADKPGDMALDARQIHGNHFTAVGQWGVDVDYYVASPVDTPRHTLRWGTEYHIPMQHTEYQDLLHLQLPGDGAYYVVLFPRDQGTSSPRFRTLGDGYILRVEGEFGNDTLFVSDHKVTDTAGSVFFEGTVASILERAGGLTLNLGAAGIVKTGQTQLTSDGPVALHRVSKEELQLSLPPDHRGTTVLITVSGSYSLGKEAPKGMEFAVQGGEYRLRIPAGIAVLTLRKTDN